jgi:hypothetical protein
LFVYFLRVFPSCPCFLHGGFFRAAEQSSRRLLSSSFALAGALTIDFLIAELLLLLLLIFILAVQLKS